MRKTGIFRTSYSKQPALENISLLPDEESRSRVMAAYEYLMDSIENSYRAFLDIRTHCVGKGEQFNVYRHKDRTYVECCVCQTYTQRGPGAKRNGTVQKNFKQQSGISHQWLITPDLWLFNR